MKLTVVTPTIFRSSLKGAVEGVGKLLLPGDEHIIVRDAAVQPKDLELYHNLPMNEYTMYLEAFMPGSMFGNGQRDCAIGMAKGDALVFLDDDDLPGEAAYKVLHELEPDPNVVHLFRMYRESDERMFYPERQRFATLGGPMVVCPRRPDLPLWVAENKYDSDFCFFEKLRDMPGMRIETHDEVICYVSGAGLGK